MNATSNGPKSHRVLGGCGGREGSLHALDLSSRGPPDVTVLPLALELARPWRVGAKPLCHLQTKASRRNRPRVTRALAWVTAVASQPVSSFHTCPGVRQRNSPQRCPRPDPQNLRMCYLTWQNKSEQKTHAGAIRFWVLRWGGGPGYRGADLESPESLQKAGRSEPGTEL